MSKPDPSIVRIEIDAANQAKAVRAGAEAEMKVARSEFTAKRNSIAARERSELKRIEQWRVKAVATIEGRPVPLDDLRFNEVSPGAIRQQRYVKRKADEAREQRRVGA